MSEAPTPVEPAKNKQTAVAAPKAVPSPAVSADKKHERLLVAYSPLVGTRVTVFLYDGAIFEGTLDSFVTEGEFALILRMATMIRPGRELIDPTIKAGMTFELMNIRFDDMAELKSAGKEGGIGTDAAIAKKKGNFGRERELAKWVPDDEPGEALQLKSPQDSGAWDQFAANEKLFGLKTDFNEEIYTTKLDRAAPHIKAKEAEADRIAREIMASPTSNVHLAEERGKSVSVDEESLYGAVIREKPPGFSEKAAAASSEAPAKTTTTTTTPLKLNPNAKEFKLSANAPEFTPSAPMTYYNKPRRNLQYGNGNTGGYAYNPYAAGYYPAAPMAPYYYADPSAVVVPAVPVVPAVVNDAAASSAAAAAEAPAKPVDSKMNPNATAFYMPTYYVPAPAAYGNYGQPAYGYYAQPQPQPQAVFSQPPQQSTDQKQQPEKQ